MELNLRPKKGSIFMVSFLRTIILYIDLASLV